MDDRVKGAIYARYSSDMQDADSIVAQVRECQAYADKNGIEVVQQYCDEERSGKTDDRPEF